LSFSAGETVTRQSDDSSVPALAVLSKINLPITFHS